MPGPSRDPNPDSPPIDEDRGSIEQVDEAPARRDDAETADPAPDHRDDRRVNDPV